MDNFSFLLLFEHRREREKPYVNRIAGKNPKNNNQLSSKKRDKVNTIDLICGFDKRLFLSYFLQYLRCFSTYHTELVLWWCVTLYNKRQGSVVEEFNSMSYAHDNCT